MNARVILGFEILQNIQRKYSNSSNSELKIQFSVLPKYSKKIFKFADSFFAISTQFD